MRAMVVKMGTGWRSGRRICGSVMWLIGVTMVLCMERFVVLAVSGELQEEALGGESGEVGGEKEGLRFEDWSGVVATEQLRRWRQKLDDEREFEAGGIYGGEEILKVAMEDDGRKEREHHRVARDRLQQWLTPMDKWHFVIGYSNVRAYSAARRLTQGARIHHLPTRNSSVHFFLTFISAASAEMIRSKRLFHVVEPLLPNLKIEDLTLGKLIRAHEDATIEEAFALKAMLAHNALGLREVKSLAKRWEVALQQDGLILSHEHTTTLRYTDTGGQMGILSDVEDTDTIKPDLQGQIAPAIVCQVSMTAIVCSGITKRSLEDAANFMASHAVVQLVELNPRFEVFNKWAKYVTQVTLSIFSLLLPALLLSGQVSGGAIQCGQFASS
ncbi:hypothetical protein M758_7G049400 [Ceratodon purpureus]|nr:hypothetical protein M758_7G049400 [Ceratodon purpureus]